MESSAKQSKHTDISTATCIQFSTSDNYAVMVHMKKSLKVKGILNLIIPSLHATLGEAPSYRKLDTIIFLPYMDLELQKASSNS